MRLVQRENLGLTGQRLLIVQPVKADLSLTGRAIICTDCTGAGSGELIYWVRGKEASFPLPTLKSRPMPPSLGSLTS